ncbi:MAG: hypothetical protein O2960_30470 [Verrucomicrobia bacterium]|nr:hypothetical protein [Verrucomicrobiota bacterium]
MSWKPRVIVFVIGQDVTGSELFSPFLTSVDSMEEETELDFLVDLADGMEEMIEVRKAGSVWLGLGRGSAC